MKKKHRNKTPDADPNTKRKRKSSKQLSALQNKRSRMEVVAYAIGIAAFVLAALAALCGLIHQRDYAIWTTCGAIVLAVIGGFCWLQDREWKKDASRQAVANRADRPHVWLESISLNTERFEGLPTPLIDLTWRNIGNRPAHEVVVKTYLTTTNRPASGVEQLPETSKGPRYKVYIPPGAKTHQNVARDDIDQSIIDKIKSGELFLYVHGYVFYKDKLANKDFTMAFCMVYDRKLGVFGLTPFGNRDD